MQSEIDISQPLPNLEGDFSSWRKDREVFGSQDSRGLGSASWQHWENDIIMHLRKTETKKFWGEKNQCLRNSKLLPNQKELSRDNNSCSEVSYYVQIINDQSTTPFQVKCYHNPREEEETLKIDWSASVYISVTKTRK